jgi:hypothetical protein
LYEEAFFDNSDMNALEIFQEDGVLFLAFEDKGQDLIE